MGALLTLGGYNREIWRLKDLTWSVIGLLNQVSFVIFFSKNRVLQKLYDHSTIYINEKIYAIPGQAFYSYSFAVEKIILGKEYQLVKFFELSIRFNESMHLVIQFFFFSKKDNDEIISTEIIPATRNIRNYWGPPIIYATSANTCSF